MQRRGARLNFRAITLRQDRGDGLGRDRGLVLNRNGYRFSQFPLDLGRHFRDGLINNLGFRITGIGYAVGVNDVDDEEDGVARFDTGARVAFGVTQFGRDGQHHAAANFLAHQAVIPALDNHSDPDREGRRFVPDEGVVERVGVPHLPDVVGDQDVARFYLGAVPVFEYLDFEFA